MVKIDPFTLYSLSDCEDMGFDPRDLGLNPVDPSRRRGLLWLGGNIIAALSTDGGLKVISNVKGGEYNGEQLQETEPTGRSVHHIQKGGRNVGVRAARTGKEKAKAFLARAGAGLGD